MIDPELGAILNALPLLENKRKDVERRADQLHAFIGFKANEDLPCRTPISIDQATEELLEFLGRSAELAKHIASMHLTSLEAIKSHIPHYYLDSRMTIPDGFEVWREMLAKRPTLRFPFDSPILLNKELSRFAHGAMLALDAMKSGNSPPHVPLSEPRAPRKRVAAAVTTLAAEIFEDLTGKPAKRHSDPITGKATGPFIHFLARLFAHFGIKASAAAQAKLLWNKDGQKRPVDYT